MGDLTRFLINLHSSRQFTNCQAMLSILIFSDPQPAERKKISRVIKSQSYINLKVDQTVTQMKNKSYIPMKTDQFHGDSWLNPLYSDQSLQMFSVKQEFPVSTSLIMPLLPFLIFWLCFHESGWLPPNFSQYVPTKNVVVSKSLFVELFAKVTERKNIIPD